MPFTRPALDYPVCRLFLDVGMGFQLWRLTERPCPTRAARQAAEASFIREFDLDGQIARGLLKRYRFTWGRRGHLEELWLVPSDRCRRTPGLRELRELLFRRPLLADAGRAGWPFLRPDPPL